MSNLENRYGEHSDLLGKSHKELLLINTIEQRNLRKKVEEHIEKDHACAALVNKHEEIRQQFIGAWFIIKKIGTHGSWVSAAILILLKLVAKIKGGH